MSSEINTQPGGVYLRFVNAMREGDVAAIRSMVVPERITFIDQPEFATTLALIQALMPETVEVREVTETGDHANLVLTGNGRHGTAVLRNVDGIWLVEGESWQ